MTTRVLIVDDHPVVRSGVAALLATTGELDVVGQAGSVDEALTLLESLEVDVVVTDLRLGEGRDGVDLTRAVRSGGAGPAVLILTTYDDDADIVRAVEAGAAGYLLKDAAPERITAAVQDAAAGRSVLEAAQAQRVVAWLGRPRPTLSVREVDVIRHVADGLSNRQIARALVISEATVKSHLVHIFTKLDVDSRTAAVAAARDLGLLPGP